MCIFSKETLVEGKASLRNRASSKKRLSIIQLPPKVKEICWSKSLHNWYHHHHHWLSQLLSLSTSIVITIIIVQIFLKSVLSSPATFCPHSCRKVFSYPATSPNIGLFTIVTKMLFRHASVSSTYPGQSVRSFVILSDFLSVSVPEPSQSVKTTLRWLTWR